MKGHRHLLAHLIAGGLIQQDDSGLAWVCASRSGHHFTNEVVTYVRERGFTHQAWGEKKRQRYKLVGAARGMLLAAPDTTPRPKRERKKKAAP